MKVLAAVAATVLLVWMVYLLLGIDWAGTRRICEVWGEERRRGEAWDAPHRVALRLGLSEAEVLRANCDKK